MLRLEGESGVSHLFEDLVSAGKVFSWGGYGGHRGVN